MSNERKDLYPTVRESRELAEKAKKFGIDKLAVSRRGGKPAETRATSLPRSKSRA